MDLNKLKTFYYVAIEGSYQKASVHLGIKPSFISKQITGLEENYQTKLFKRSHRSLILTEQGKEFLKAVQVIIDQLELVDQLAKTDKREEDDIIRIVTTTGVTNLWLVQKLKGFIKLYPKYKFRIIAVEEKVDFASHFADIGILPKIDPHSDVIQRKLFTCYSRLYASKKYLKEFGVPETANDLDNHRLISYYHNEAGHRGNVDWHLTLGVKNKRPRVPFLVINSAMAQLEAAAQGYGILAVCKELLYDRVNLVKVLPKEGVAIPVHLALHVHKRNLTKVVLMEKFFTKEIKEAQYDASANFQ